MLDKSSICQEMDITKLFKYIEEKSKYSYQDLIVKDGEISSLSLPKFTGILFATIEILRYGKELLNFKVLTKQRTEG